MLRKYIHTIVACMMCSIAIAEPLAIGAEVPVLKATDQNGKAIALTERLAEGLSLIYFYPKASTGG